jgi:hypothetical protein
MRVRTASCSATLSAGCRTGDHFEQALLCHAINVRLKVNKMNPKIRSRAGAHARIGRTTLVAFKNHAIFSLHVSPEVPHGTRSD